MIPSRAFVVGYPRTGFTLLISVIAEILNLTNPEKAHRHTIKVLCDSAGMRIAERISQVFQHRGISRDLIYNYNFRQTAGGPKWLKDGDDGTACFRKYIGIKGKGDFTLITSHPRQILDYYEILHSHVAPSRWIRHPAYQEHQFFSSIRHPAGTVTSACFSLNALASEYIQKFVPTQEDNDSLRQKLALYKLSDLKFFDALLGPYKAYLAEFNRCANQYVLMRWEDLIERPLHTIVAIAESLGYDLTDQQAAKLWARLDHVNLTGAHKHNFRLGHGIAQGWKSWITNTHLQIMRDHGFDELAEQYGYGPIEPLDESAYSPFQKELAGYLKRREIFRDYGDQDLFGFAFNKSNIDFSGFGFKQYPWRTHTRIERSSCVDEQLVMEVSDVAEEACGIFNDAFSVLEEALGSAERSVSSLGLLTRTVSRLYDNADDLDAFTSAMREAMNSDRAGGVPCQAMPSTPVLLESRGTTNIVHFRSRYYAVPQALGPIDFSAPDLSKIAFAGVSDSLSELVAILEKR